MKFFPLVMSYTSTISERHKVEAQEHTLQLSLRRMPYQMRQEQQSLS